MNNKIIYPVKFTIYIQFVYLFNHVLFYVNRWK